jgi:hypothetical protein
VPDPLDALFAQTHGQSQANPLDALFSQTHGQPDVRAQIAARNAGASATPEEEGPIRRFLQGAGLPTSKDEFVGLIKTLATPGGPGPAMAGGVINMLTREAGAEAGAAQADMAQGNYGGAAKHALGAAVPFLGHPIAEGNIAGAAGRAASIAAPELLRTPAMRSSLPEALDASAAAQNAKVVNPAGNMPALAESIGSQMAKGGMVMRNPRAELPGAFGMTERGPSIVETPVQQFRNPASAQKQLAALQEKYPDAQIATEGDKFVIREMRDPAPPQTPEQQAAMKLAPTAQKPSPILARSLGAHGAATVAGYVGHALGGPTGAAIGAGAVEAAMLAKRIMTNPLARTLQAAAKSKLASALRSGDVATLAQIGARVLNGNDLNDEYGHDQAVWDVVNSAHTEAGGDPQIARQILATKEPLYVTPAGDEIRPPYHIIQAFRNQVGGNVPNNVAGMAARDAKGGQASTGRQTGVQGQVMQHDWMGHPVPSGTGME